MHRIFTRKPCLAPIHVNLLKRLCGVPCGNGGSRTHNSVGREASRAVSTGPAAAEAGGPRSGSTEAAAASRRSRWAVPCGTPPAKNKPQLKPRSKHKGEGRRPTSPRHSSESAGLPGDKAGPRRRAGRRSPPHHRARPPFPSLPAEEKRHGGREGRSSYSRACNVRG